MDKVAYKTETTSPKDLEGSKSPVPAPQTDIVYEFRISRLQKPVQFKNLWKLETRIPGTTIYSEIIDADMLTTVIDRIRYLFEQDGL